MTKIKGATNSLYFTVVQLALDAKRDNKEPESYQMNSWTFDNLLDEVGMFSPTQLNEKEGKILGIPYLINNALKDTDIVLVLKKELDKPIIVLVK